MDNFIFLPSSSLAKAGNSATGELSVALGKNCTASGLCSVAMGQNCDASGVCSVAMGENCDTSGNYCVALGVNTIAGGAATALGGGSWAYGKNSIAAGDTNRAWGWGSVAMGQGCHARGDNTHPGVGTAQNIAMGFTCDASAQQAVALGRNCCAFGNQSFADGSGCVASGVCSVAMGYACDASAQQAVAIGRECKASGDQCVALGNGADASGTEGFVYRSNAGNTFVFDDASPPSLKINGVAAAGGGGSDLSGGIAWLLGTATQQTNLAVPTAVSNLPDGTNVRVTLVGAGGGGAGGSATMGGGGGGGGGAMQYWLTTPITRKFIIGAGAGTSAAGQNGDWGGYTQDPHAGYQAAGGSGGAPGGAESGNQYGWGGGGNLMPSGTWVGFAGRQMVGGIGAIGTTFNVYRRAAGGVSGNGDFLRGSGGQGGLINAVATYGGTTGCIQFEWFG